MAIRVAKLSSHLASERSRALRSNVAQAKRLYAYNPDQIARHAQLAVASAKPVQGPCVSIWPGPLKSEPMTVSRAAPMDKVAWIPYSLGISVIFGSHKHTAVRRNDLRPNDRVESCCWRGQ
jgi:hypothetical protein